MVIDHTDQVKAVPDVEGQGESVPDPSSFPLNSNMPFSGSLFLINYDTAKLRVSIIFLIPAAAGDRCSSLRSKLRLVQDRAPL